jgi:nucleoside-diphosphate-sugar epimerase
MKRILVTGTAGFIGYGVAKLLLDQENEVVGIDNMKDYYDVSLKEWRLSRIEGFRNFSFVKGDISDYGLLSELFNKHTFDIVINLAARAGVRASVQNPWIYLDTNLKGTLNLLECCKKRKVKHFILASTSSLYGFNDMPFIESQRSDSPLAPYGATKKGAEVLSYSYHYLYGVNVIIPRYFTVYGPAGRPDMSIFKFIKNIDQGKPIPVFGDGRQKRDFTYIDDIADGTVRCMNMNGYELVNFGNDKPVVLMDVIHIVEGVLGKKAEIRWLDRHPADVEATWADITKAHRSLQWEPQVNIEEGIERTVKWYKENRNFILSLREVE